MAKTRADSFAHGEVIYREGDSGGFAFAVESGRVALSRELNGVPQTVKVAENGDIFGEPGPVEGAPRGETATAVGHVTVKPLNRGALVRAHARAETQARLRLRKQGRTLDAAPWLSVFAPAFVHRLLSAAWFRRAAPEAPPSRLDVRVCSLTGDNGEGQRRIVSLLEDLKDVRVRPLPRSFEFDPAGGPASITALDAQIRRVAVDCGADLVVWGERAESDTPLKVRFTSRARPDPAAAGAFGPWDILPVRDTPDPALDALLRAAALAAMVPSDAHRRSLHGLAFQPALQPAIEVVKTLPLDLTQSERASAHIAFAHISATAGQHGGSYSQVARDLLELAREAYLQGIEDMEGGHSPILRAMAHKNLGSLLIGGEDTAGEAVDHIEDALSAVEKTELPWEWAALQDNLGTALYKMETSRDGANSEALKKSLAAYRNAALVYTRDDAPEKWASLQTGIARVAQILGKHRNDPRLLERAVAACEQALLVRSRKRTPGLWASTQNNLGTALFLLAEITGRDSALGYAAEAFRAALSVYNERGPVRMVATVERNLARVEGRMNAAAHKGSKLVDWGDIGRPGEAKNAVRGVETAAARGAAPAGKNRNNRFSPYDLAPIPRSAPHAEPASEPAAAAAAAPRPAAG